jgi:hypothetical protein
MMHMKKNSKGKFPYKSMLDCFTQIVKKEGIFKLWIGFPMFYIRIAPHVMSHLLILDWLNQKDKQYGH